MGVKDLGNNRPSSKGTHGVISKYAVKSKTGKIPGQHKVNQDAYIVHKESGDSD